MTILSRTIFSVGATAALIAVTAVPANAVYAEGRYCGPDQRAYLYTYATGSSGQVQGWLRWYDPSIQRSPFVNVYLPRGSATMLAPGRVIYYYDIVGKGGATLKSHGVGCR